MTRRILLVATLALLSAMPVGAASATFTLSVQAGKHDRRNVPVRVPLTLPVRLFPRSAVVEDVVKSLSVTVRDSAGNTIKGQLTGRSLLAEKEPLLRRSGVQRELHFILPRLDAGRTATYTATVANGGARPQQGFTWHDTPRVSTELRFANRPVLRYMYRPLDESSPAAREQSYKVFHHLFDPAGRRLVTKGPGGRFTHHRGLFYAFNKITYGDNKKADVWHATGDAHQSHARLLSTEEGPVLGRHRVVVNWHGVGKEVFAREEREVTVYNVPGGQLVEFASRLRATGGKVLLDGDPQHAGFHFRADNEVAEKTAKQTYYLRPDGVGKPGETRNWPNDKTHVNLSWNAMSFVLGEQRFTAAYLDRPANPKEARFSERDYGRFGSYFEYALEPDKPLTVGYRVWLQEGEITAANTAAMSVDFTEPVTVIVK